MEDLCSEIAVFGNPPALGPEKPVLARNGKRVYKIKWSKRAGKQRQIWPIIGQGWASNGKDGRTWEGVSKSVMPHSARCARLARRFGASKR